jgi:hypothetical protein
MLKRLLYTILCSASAGTVALAHHSYADYFREQKVAVEGTLEQLTLANPHAILAVRTDDGKVFTAEWGNAVQLHRTGFVDSMLTVGDRVIVTGSPARDPESHRLSLLTEIRRPRDGWQWSRNGIAVLKEDARAGSTR